MTNALTVCAYRGKWDGLEGWFQQEHPAAGTLTLAEVPPLENEQSARVYLQNAVNASQPALAVPFHGAVPTGSAGQRKLRERLAKAEERWQNLTNKGLETIRAAKAANIGCKGCGSKLARSYLKSHLCPVCGKSLFPAGTEKRSSALQQEVAELTESLRRTGSTNASGPEIVWLVGLITPQSGNHAAEAVVADTKEPAPSQSEQPSLFSD